MFEPKFNQLKEQALLDLARRKNRNNKIILAIVIFMIISIAVELVLITSLVYLYFAKNIIKREKLILPIPSRLRVDPQTLQDICNKSDKGINICTLSAGRSAE